MTPPAIISPDVVNCSNVSPVAASMRAPRAPGPPFPAPLEETVQPYSLGYTSEFCPGRLSELAEILGEKALSFAWEESV
jgi:hypothetical protein